MQDTRTHAKIVEDNAKFDREFRAKCAGDHEVEKARKATPEERLLHYRKVGSSGISVLFMLGYPTNS